MNYRKAAICTLVLLLLSLPVFKAETSSTPTILYVDPPKIMDTSKQPGQYFSVNISIAEVYWLYGYVFKVGYNTSIVKATNVTIRDFFPPPSEIWIIKLEINNITGYVWVSVALLYPSHVSGNGTLAQIEFQVQSIGRSILDLYDTNLQDSIGFVPHNVVDGYFSNALLGDVNIDGSVNMTDLHLMADAFGSTPSDLNWNPYADWTTEYGLVDIFDLIIVAVNYGKTWEY